MIMIIIIILVGELDVVMYKVGGCQIEINIEWLRLGINLYLLSSKLMHLFHLLVC